MIRKNRILGRSGSSFTIILAISLLLTLLMSRPVASLVVVEYKLPLSRVGADSRPRDIDVLDSGSTPDLVCFTEQTGGRIGIIDRSSSPYELSEYILPFDPSIGNSEPWGLDRSSSGNILWFTDYKQNRIGRFDLMAGTLEEWLVPTSDSGPRGIVAIDENQAFFTEFQTGKIGYIDSLAPSFREWQLPNLGCQPNDIIVIGQTVYFTEYGGDKIGAIFYDAWPANPYTLKEFKLPGGSAPWSLVADSNGMIWFTCSSRNVIGMLNPSTGDVLEHRSIPTDSSQPRGIAVDGATGNVWFTEYSGHKVTRYVPGENVFYEYPTLEAGSAVNDVAIHRRTAGVVDAWFTEYGTNRIGQISQDETDNVAAYGTTSTTTVTQITSAVSASFRAASSTTTASSFDGAANVPATTAIQATSLGTLDGTSTSSAIRTETAYKLSTSTMGTTTSFIVEVRYTTITNTTTSTTFVSTQSLTSSVTYTSTSTSYIGTTSATSTSTSWVTVETATESRTSTSQVFVPNTLSTTVTETRGKTTVPASTSTTTTSTVRETLRSTEYTTSATTTTTTRTTTTTPTTTTYTIPPFPEIGAIPGYPIESIIVGIGLAATFLVILSRRKRGRT